jgi:hypothetical protein
MGYASMSGQKIIDGLHEAVARTKMTITENGLFTFLMRKYTQAQDDRQRAMGLTYTTAETHDLAKEISTFLNNNVDSLFESYEALCLAVEKRTGEDPRLPSFEEYEFEVEQRVEKHTGDYKAYGTVVGMFRIHNGQMRYVVEHKAEGGGCFYHIYSAANLRKDWRDEPLEMRCRSRMPAGRQGGYTGFQCMRSEKLVDIDKRATSMRRSAPEAVWRWIRPETTDSSA